MRRPIGVARAAAVLAGLVAWAPAAPAQPDFAWEAGASLAATGFDATPGDRSAWSDGRAWARRRLEGGSLRFEARRVERFGATDGGATADAWVGLGPRAYADFRIDLAPDAEVLPEYGFRAEAYVSPVAGWEVSAGWRRRGFDGEPVDEAIASVAEYVGRWYLRQRVTALFGGGEDGGLALELVGRRTLATARDFVEGGVGIGPTADVTGVGPVVTAADRKAAWIRFEAFPWPRLGFAVGGEAAVFDAPLPDRRTASAAVLTRW